MASGISYFNNKEYPFAMREFKEVLNLDPRHREAKDYIENINDILEDRKLRAQKVEQAESFYLSGINNANNNKFDAASDDFVATLDLIKDYKDARQRLNDLTRRKKEFDEKERARRIKEIDRKFQEGIVAYSQGKYRKARDAFQMTLELDRNNALAKEFLQKTLDALLIEEEEVVDENSPKYAFIYSDNVAGKSLFQKGDYTGSRKKWESILNLQPKNKVAREYIVRCDLQIYPDKKDSTLTGLFQEGREDFAKKEYRAALSTFDIIKSIDNTYQDIDTRIAETKNKIKEGQERNLTFTDKNLDQLYKESLALKDKGGRENYETALVKLKQVRQKEPNNLNAAILYGQISSQLSVGIGEGERKKVLNADQRSKVTKYRYNAIRYVNNNEILKAINEYKKVLDIDPDDEMAKNNKLYLTKQLTRTR
jgi:tetratricopeptide (TPR) repeat protein